MRRGENIYRRKDGRWEGRFSCGKGADGKTIYKSVYGQSYNEVKIKINGSKEQKAEISDTQKQGTKSGIADLWLSSVRMKSKQSTYSCYRSLYTTHLQNEIGSVRVDIINESTDALQREIIETENELRNLETEASNATFALKKIGDAGEVLQNVGDKISDVGSTLTKTVTVPIAAAGTAAVKTASDFDTAMSKVAAVSGATGDS